MGWSYTYDIFGEKVTVPPYLEGEEDEGITAVQRDAFLLLKQNGNKFFQDAADAIFSYYQAQLPRLREKFGSSAEEHAPFIQDKGILSELMTPSSIILKEPLISDERIIGLLFDCTWEPSLGLAVKFVNKEIEEVGFQDIVL